MNLIDVLAELGDRLASLPRTQVLVWSPDTVRPPSVLIPLPERINFDAAYQRGADEVDVEFTLVVGRANARQATKLLARYVEVTGPYSVKELADSSVDRPWTTCDDFWVSSVEPDIVRISEVDHLALVFKAKVFGNGKGE